MLNIDHFEFNHIQVNCYLLWDETTRQCAIVDPGMKTADETAKLIQFIGDHHLSPTLILLTHAHVDHIAGLREVCSRYGLPVTMHKDGVKLLRQASGYGAVLGFDIEQMDDLPTSFVDDGDTLTLATSTIECRHVPGHCPGSICYVLNDEHAVLTGDALFHFSIGRTDLPGGDYDLLVDKLRTRILTLPDDYRILPGHGIPSMIWKEKKYNSFLC